MMEEAFVRKRGRQTVRGGGDHQGHKPQARPDLKGKKCFCFLFRGSDTIPNQGKKKEKFGVKGAWRESKEEADALSGDARVARLLPRGKGEVLLEDVSFAFRRKRTPAKMFKKGKMKNWGKTTISSVGGERQPPPKKEMVKFGELFRGGNREGREKKARGWLSRAFR